MTEKETLERRALLCRSAKELIDLIHGELDEDSEYVYRGTPERHRWDETIDIEADEKRINSSIFRKYGKNPNPNNSEGRDVCPSPLDNPDDNKNRGIEFDDKYLPIHIEQEVIEDARPHFPHLTSNTEILTDIRHFGGLTTLIDFSRDLMVALFFACHEKPNEDGQLIVLPTNKIKRSNHPYFSDHSGKSDHLVELARKLQNFDHSDKNDSFSEIAKILQNSDYSDKNSTLPKEIGLIEPAKTPTSSVRVIAQKSVFIHAPEGFIPPDSCKIITINVKLKPELLEHLRQCHHINQTTIYNDLHGFIGIQDSFAEARLAIYAAEKYIEDEEYGEALKEYNKAIKLRPDSAEAHLDRGLTRMLFNHPIDKIISDFNKAINLKPDFTRAYILRGTINFSIGEFDEVIEDFTNVIESDPKKYPAAYYVLGLAYQNLDDDKNAQANFAKAAELGYEMPNDELILPEITPNPQKGPKSK